MLPCKYKPQKRSIFGKKTALFCGFASKEAIFGVILNDSIFVRHFFENLKQTTIPLYGLTVPAWQM